MPPAEAVTYRRCGPALAGIEHTGLSQRWALAAHDSGARWHPAELADPLRSNHSVADRHVALNAMESRLK